MDCSQDLSTLPDKCKQQRSVRNHEKAAKKLIVYYRKRKLKRQDTKVGKDYHIGLVYYRKRKMKRQGT